MTRSRLARWGIALFVVLLYAGGTYALTASGSTGPLTSSNSSCASPADRFVPEDLSSVTTGTTTTTSTIVTPPATTTTATATQTSAPATTIESLFTTTTTATVPVTETQQTTVTTTATCTTTKTITPASRPTSIRLRLLHGTLQAGSPAVALVYAYPVGVKVTVSISRGKHTVGSVRFVVRHEPTKVTFPSSELTTPGHYVINVVVTSGSGRSRAARLHVAVLAK
jgi:hypothetical protein